MESVIRTWWRHLIIFDNLMACMTDDTDDNDYDDDAECVDSDDHDESGVECTIASAGSSGWPLVRARYDFPHYIDHFIRDDRDDYFRYLWFFLKMLNPLLSWITDFRTIHIILELIENTNT